MSLYFSSFYTFCHSPPASTESPNYDSLVAVHLSRCLLWAIYVSEIRLSFFFDVDANRVIINSKGNNECLQCWYLRSGWDDFCKCKCHLRSQNEEGTFSYFYTRCRWAAPRFSMINFTCLFLFQSKWLQRLKKWAVGAAIWREFQHNLMAVITHVLMNCS